MLTLSHLPADLRSAVERETRGEVVRWIGRPRPMTVLAKAAPIWLMGIPWSALTFTIFGALILAVLAGKPPTRVVHPWEYWAMAGAVVFTAGFVLVGLGMLLAPIYAAMKARRTVHVITDRKLLTITAGRSTSVGSIAPAEILRIDRQQRPDGAGTLRVVTGIGRDSDGDKYERTEELIGVAEAQKAEVLLRALISGSRDHD